jgi:copper(I)-binding protein
MILLVACGPANKTPVASQNGIEISDVSIRLLDGSMPAAGYLTIKNTGGINDRLIGVTCDAAQQLMLHQSSVDANGVASMKMVVAIDVPAGQQVNLEPGGYHIMLAALHDGFKAGSIVTLTLQFEHAGAVSVPVQVTTQ